MEFLSAVPVGMLPSLTGISELEAYKNNETVVRFADEASVITDAVDNGRAIGFEHGPSVQAGLLTSQGIIENMFQDIVTNGTDIAEAAKTAETRLNEFEQATKRQLWRNQRQQHNTLVFCPAGYGDCHMSAGLSADVHPGLQLYQQDHDQNHI